MIAEPDVRECERGFRIDGYKAGNPVGFLNVPVQETPRRSIKQEQKDSIAGTKKEGDT